MAERGVGGASQIRVVRCPNCNNLLPELPRLGAYRCGGCNAVLQARKQTPALGSSLVRSDGGEIKFVGNLENDLDSVAYESSMEESNALVFEAMVKNATSNVDELAIENIERRRKKKMGIRHVDRDGRVREKEASEDGERFRALIPREALKDQKRGIPFSPNSIEGRLDKYRRPTREYVEEDLDWKQSQAGTRRVDYLEQDPVELLRKLDELRDHITRSYEIVDKQRERRSGNRRAALSSFNHKHHSPLFSEEGSPWDRRYATTHLHCLNRNDVGMPSFHTPMHVSNGTHGYRERYRRAPYSRYAEYAERPRDSYPYSHFDLDPAISDHNNCFHHQTACSCLHCFDQHLLPPGQVPSICIRDQRAGNSRFHPADRSSLLSSESYDRRFTDSPLYSPEVQSQERVSLRRRVQRCCQPIGGAAPFIICSNCFELLQLPSKIPHRAEKLNKVSCGSCSQVIISELDEKVIGLSMTGPAVPVTANNGSRNYQMNRDLQHQKLIGGNSVPPKISPEDDIHSVDDNPVSPKIHHQIVEDGRALNLICSAKVQGLSTSSSNYKDVERLESIGCVETTDYKSGNVESQDLQYHNLTDGSSVFPLCENHGSLQDDLISAGDNLISPTIGHQITEKECGLSMSFSAKTGVLSASSSSSGDVEHPEDIKCGETREYRSRDLENQDLHKHELSDGNHVLSHSKDYDRPLDDLNSAGDNLISPTIGHQITEKECGLSMSFSAKIGALSASSSSSGNVEHPEDIKCGETREYRSGDLENQDLHKHELSDGNHVLSHSKDYDSPQVEIHSTDDKVVSPTIGHQMTEKGYGLNMNYSAKMEEVFSISSSTSRDVEGPEDLGCGETRDYRSLNVENQDLHYHETIDGNFVFAQSKEYVSMQGEDHSADDDPVSPALSHQISEKECGLNMKCSEEVQDCYMFSGRSGNEESPENIGPQRDSSNLSKLSFDAQVASYIFGLPKNSVHPFFRQEMDGSEEESMSSNSCKENVVKGDLMQQSVEDAQVANEIDLSFNEYPDSGFSEGSIEVGPHEDQPRVGKSGNSFFSGLVKKSFKDFSLFNQPVRSDRYKVSINGHPISDRLLKKAEKKAGPVDPGDYWYDCRAGFWGVVGRECVGIIPPFIKEFKYPMLKNCADGNTGVLVNGRELNQKDLDLLVERGLNRTSGRSYIIEMSGKVFDEASGKELHNLGKLAPTVEILKRGFGMRVPKEFN